MTQNENTLIALVTGGNKGIGFELARQLGQEGHTVILTARNQSLGEAAAESLRNEGLNVTFHSLDVTQEQAIQDLFRYISEHFGRLDLLINNAGIILDEAVPGLEVDLDTVRTTLETNTLAPLRMIQVFHPLLTKSKSGRILNISSGLGALEDMGRGYPGYRISKTALNAVTRITADELAASGIAVNAVCPGWVQTDMGGPNAERTAEGSVKGILRFLLQPQIPTGQFVRDGKPIPW